MTDRVMDRNKFGALKNIKIKSPKYPNFDVYKKHQLFGNTGWGILNPHIT